MKRLDLDSYFISIARTVGERSTCSRGQTGAVVVKDKKVVSTGYNGPPSGHPHEPHIHSREECKAIHAEINAIQQATIEELKGSTMYCTRSPCPVCSEWIIKTQIREVVFWDKHPSYTESRRILERANIVVRYHPNITYEEV